MLWARDLARRRFRAHPLAVSAIRTTVMVLICMARDMSTLPRVLSTEDTKDGVSTRSDSLKRSIEELSDTNHSTQTLAPPPFETEPARTQDPLPKFERLKTKKPPVMPLDLKQILFPKGALAGWPVSPSNSPLQVMAETNSPEMIWEAYRTMKQQNLHIPPALLQRITRVLIRKYAPTRETFIRLHDVLVQLQKQGDRIALWQWNALIHYAGEGLRKLNTAHYHAALDIYWELLATQRLPNVEQHIKPDIRTYTTLLHIAVRTNNPQHVQHALSLLKESKLELDRVARLTLIPFYTHCHDFAALRRLARSFSDRGEDIGIDGINAYIWAFGKWGRLEVVREVYSCLRANIKQRSGDKTCARDASETRPVSGNLQPERHPEELLVEKQAEYIKNVGVDDLDQDDTLEPFQPVPFEAKRFSKETLDLAILDHHVPDQITYTLCMQVFAFHGDLRQVLEIFREMLSTPDHTRPGFKKAAMFEANQQAYRSLFMAFVKFSNRKLWLAREAADTDEGAEEVQEVEGQETGTENEEDRWIDEALYFVFDSFLSLDPSQSRPGNRTVRYLMQAFQNVTQHDTRSLVSVWMSLEERFGRLKVPPIFTDVARTARNLRNL